MLMTGRGRGGVDRLHFPRLPRQRRAAPPAHAGFPGPL